MRVCVCSCVSERENVLLCVSGRTPDLRDKNGRFDPERELMSASDRSCDIHLKVHVKLVTSQNESIGNSFSTKLT